MPKWWQMRSVFINGKNLAYNVMMLEMHYE